MRTSATDMRTSAGVALVFLAMATAACDAANDELDVDGRDADDRAAQPLVEAARVEELLAVLDTHDGVVAGVVEVRSASGDVLGTRPVQKHDVPDQIADLLENGGSDEQGFAYYDVTGAQGDGELEVRYRYIRRHLSSAPRAPDVVPAQDPGVGTDDAELAAYMADPEAPEEVEVYVRLEQPFSTQLKLGSARGLASLLAAEQDRTARVESIANRKSEAAALQAPTVQALEELGAHDVGSYWTSNAVSAIVPTNRLLDIARMAGVARVELSVVGEPESSTQWDGVDMKAAGGLNAGIYHDAGYHGQAYADSGRSGGRLMRVAMIGTEGYWNHAGFLDTPNSSSRAKLYNCTSWPCLPNQSASTGVNAHDLKCAGIAAGSIRQGQLSGFTNVEELERTGIAEEPEIYFLEGHSSTATKRAIELAIDLELDVLFAARGYGSGCAGSGAADLEQSVMAAQQANIITMKSGGNDGHAAGCSVTYPGDTPSVFTVGGVGSGSSTCTSSDYSSCPIWSGTARGGVDATIDGVTSTGALSAVAAVVPACVQYYLQSSSPFVYTYSDRNPECGSSYAVPQVAGAAALMKDYFLANGDTFIRIEGRPFVVLLAMTDRQGGGILRRPTGFHDLFGGGRFQMRRFDSSDHSGSWGWESYSHLFAAEGPHEHQLFGSGAEPVGIQQFKVYSMFFEEDAANIAKIDLRVRDDNCSSTSSSLGLDSSDDVKKMVRLGSFAGGEKLCARLNAIHLPVPFPQIGYQEPRRAHVFAYYSSDTSMR
jgi:hypothetical protein